MGEAGNCCCWAPVNCCERGRGEEGAGEVRNPVVWGVRAPGKTEGKEEEAEATSWGERDEGTEGREPFIKCWIRCMPSVKSETEREPRCCVSARFLRSGRFGEER